MPSAIYILNSKFYSHANSWQCLNKLYVYSIHTLLAGCNSKNCDKIAEMTIRVYLRQEVKISTSIRSFTNSIHFCIGLCSLQALRINE